MKHLRYRRAARTDLERIWAEGRERWGLDAAESYIRSIHSRLLALLDHPAKGSDRSFIVPGVRKWTVMAHHAYYRSDEAGIDVIRILHPAMDVEAAMLPLD